MGCFNGDTKIRVGYNIEEISESIPIRKIPELLEKRRLFTYSFVNQSALPIEIITAKEITYSSDLVKILIKLIPTNELCSIVCTSWSKILLLNGCVIKAKKLKPETYIAAYPFYYGKVLSIDRLDEGDYVYAIDVLSDNYLLDCGIFVKS